MSQGVYVLGGKCPRGKCPRGKCPGGICPWGKCPGGTCLGGYVLEPNLTTPRWKLSINSTRLVSRHVTYL